LTRISAIGIPPGHPTPCSARSATLARSTGLEDPDLYKDVQRQVPPVGGSDLRKHDPVQRLGRELSQRSRPEHRLQHPRYETPHCRRLGSHLQH
jgi:hypothetical protein